MSHQVREWGAFLFLGVMAWGTSFLWIKVGLQELAPFTLVMYRMIFGAIGAWAITLFLRQPWQIPRSKLPVLLLLGIFYTAIPITLITWAELRIDSGLAGLLNGTVPLFTMLFAHFALADDRFTTPKVSGLVAGFIGLVILVSRDLTPQGLSGNIWGQLAVVLAAAMYGVCNIVVRLRLKDLNPIHIASVSLTSSAVTMVILTMIFEPPIQIPVLPITWFAAIWMGVIGLSLAYYANFYLMNSWGATRTSLVTYIIPISAITLGVLILGERPSWHVFVGGALIIGGIALVNVRLRAFSGK